MAARSSSESSDTEADKEDLSYNSLSSIPENMFPNSRKLTELRLHHNDLTILPRTVGQFVSLETIDISNNRIAYVSPEIGLLTGLKQFIARNNLFEDDALPKEFFNLKQLEVLNLSGNLLREFPPSAMELPNLRKLCLGANQIHTVPCDIQNLNKLEFLYLGGNQLQEMPASVGQLRCLRALILCDNQLESIPSTISSLRRLESLSLHNNRLSTLPPEIVSLDLVELSLRGNPLIMRFAQDLSYEPPSLLELAGRVVKVRGVSYSSQDLPRTLIHYLDSAHRCVNPKCKGVYFSAKVEHVKFVDFCGKYRLPLLQYLCSPQCTTHPQFAASSSESDSSDSEDSVVRSRIRKILLG